MRRAVLLAGIVLALGVGPAPTHPAEPIVAVAPVDIWAEGFDNVCGLAVDEAGNLFVSDRAAGTVTRIGPDRAQAVVVRFLKRPVGLAIDPEGRLLIAEEHANRVVRLEPNGTRTVLVSKVKQPRWLAVDEQGRLFISARRPSPQTDPEPDESAEPETILALSPSGTLAVFADRFRRLQGLAVGDGMAYAATRGRAGEPAEAGAVFRIPILPDGTAGLPIRLGPPDSFKRPVGLALDHLGAVFLTTQELDGDPNDSRRAVAKLAPDGTLTPFASQLRNPQGLAFDAEGHLYLADGRGGRVLRFRAPPPPVLVTPPGFTRDLPLAVTGATEPGARVALVVNEAPSAIVGVSDETGAFSLVTPLAPNAPNTLEVFATASLGAGLSSPPATATVVHDDVSPSVAVLQPGSGGWLRQTVAVEIKAADGGSGVAALTASVAGHPLTPSLSPALPAPTTTATSTWDTRGVIDGAQTLTVTATDRAANHATVTRAVIVDNTPPETSITEGPVGDASGPGAVFTFSGADNLTPAAGLLFAWRIDGDPFTPFTASLQATVGGLSEGRHTLEVEAVDLAGNEDPTPATRSFDVAAAGDFTLSVAPAAARVVAGDETSVSVAAGGGALASLVSLGVSPERAGITATVSPALLAPGGVAAVTFRVSGAAAPGTFAFTVTGQAQLGGVTLARGAPVTVEVLAATTPAVTGRVMTAEAIPRPLPGVTVTLGSAFTLTDAGGNFVLLAPPGDANMLLIDGRTASTPTAQYPPVEVSIAVSPTGPTRVPFVVYLPALDTAHPVALPLDPAGFTSQDVQATTPLIPGLVVTVPAGTRIVGPDGNPVAQITITPVPIDRSPMPFPAGVNPPMLFSIQPGGAVPSRPLPITFPNLTEAPPGAQADLYYFDLTAGAWAIWGTGTVSEDGTAVVSDPGFGLPRFAWHFWDVRRPTELVRRIVTGGEPVDLQSGRFVVEKTDLAIPGGLTIAVERTYRSGDSRPGLFGIGWNLTPYDHTITSNGATLSLVLADQNAFQLSPIGPGRWANGSEPVLRGAVVTQLPGDFNFQIRFRDGTVHRYDRIVGFVNSAGLSTITDRNGNTIAITRQPVGPGLFGRVTQVTEPGGRALALSYDGAGRIIAATDPIGRVVRYGYDALGRLATVTDAAGGVTAYAYDAGHRIVSITDPRGITFLANEYDGQRRVVRQRQADGSEITFAYATSGGVVTATTVTDPEGRATTVRFDGQGLPIARVDALGQTTTFDYTPGSNLLASTTDPIGRVTRYEYDTAGNPTRVTDPAGQSEIFTYDATFGLPTSATGPLGDTVRFERDGRGNLTGVIDSLGQRTRIEVDALGRPIAITDPLGHRTRLGYDAVGNLTTIEDPLGHRATLAWDAVSRLVARTDSRGRRTEFGYDALGRVASLLDATGGLVQVTYDGNGNVVTVTDPLGNRITHVHDEMDRLQSRNYAGGGTERYEYSRAGHLVRHVDPGGRVAVYTYDALGRRATATYGDGTTTYRYDAAGRPAQVSDLVGGALSRQYDVLDRLVAEAGPLGTVAYEYDAGGRRIAMTIAGQPVVRYGYDAASRLTEVRRGASVAAIDYDAAGRRTRLTLPSGATTEYEYDAASRLVGLGYRGGAGPIGDLRYAYDEAGNVIGLGGSLARTALPEPVAGATYDADNRQLAFGDETMTYDPRGSLTSIAGSSGLTAFEWDGRNRLVGLSGPGVTAAFQYDAFGRRVGASINGSTTTYLHDGPDVAQEVRDGQATDYLRLLEVDSPLARGDSEFYLTDALGSVVGLTDPTGSLVTRYVYEPFGRTRVEGAGSANAFRFTGREDDGATGLYYYRARYYHPGLARFISEDPIGLRGGVNVYAYAFNSPLNWTDPTGLDVYIARYVCCGSFNHIGIAVNSYDTFGLYSRIDGYRAITGAPAEVAPDWQYHPEGPLYGELIRIPTTPEQDAAIQAFIERARQNPGTYRLGGRNCGTFVQEALAAGGIPTPGTIFPNRLGRNLLNRFGPVVRASPHYAFP
jgi:RHS repeat-associated protein